LDPFRLGALGYANKFTIDTIHKCGEASLGFPCEVFLRKKKQEKGLLSIASFSNNYGGVILRLLTSGIMINKEPNKYFKFKSTDNISC
jgi:hypothetical protein